MNQNETVAHMAAVIYAARTAGRKVVAEEGMQLCDDAANEAWDLYNAVQYTSTGAAKRGTSRYGRI